MAHMNKISSEASLVSIRPDFFAGLFSGESVMPCGQTPERLNPKPINHPRPYLEAHGT